MGIPYSREIHAAFDQVTPLVAAGFEVLQTTKNISIVLAAIQVLTVLTLMFILMVLIGILYAVNPDLEDERKALVTPVMRWLARVSVGGIVATVSYLYAVFFCFLVLAAAGYALLGGNVRVSEPGDQESEVEVEEEAK